MFAYYCSLALRSLGRNRVLTLLMIATIAVGIAASITVLTVFRAMSGDPIPGKSGRLYAPQIDSWGPDNRSSSSSARYDGLQDQLSYIDALGLMHARAAVRQSALYRTELILTPSDPKLTPFNVDVRVGYAQLFSMFDVPFRYGGPWGTADDDAHASVAVITRQLNDNLFGGANSIGRTIQLNDEEYRIVGVLDQWKPVPRFYDLDWNRYGQTEEIFLPFTHAIDRKMPSAGDVNCNHGNPGWEALLSSDCVWIQFWVELPTRADAARYRNFLGSYASEQRRSGRFHWPARTQLRDVREWLSYEGVVPDEVRIIALVSFSFLFVCLLNAMGLMLARLMSRTADLAVRRALGASRDAIFMQCLIESAVIGVLGGALGLLLSELLLLEARALISGDILELAHLDWVNVAIAVVLSIAVTILAGLYPTWRAARIQPAWQLKAQ